MPTSASDQRNTADEILDVAETLIQTRGYSAFSYQDVADALGIRKASIHYHFPSKADLGAAVIDRYSQHFETALAALGEDPDRGSSTLLDFYLEPYLAYAGTRDRVCLCGALAGEMMALPDAMRARVERFFTAHQDWLAAIIARGVGRGEFRPGPPPTETARLVFGALQGALLVKRATGNERQFADVVAALKRHLAPA